MNIPQILEKQNKNNLIQNWKRQWFFSLWELLVRKCQITLFLQKVFPPNFHNSQNDRKLQKVTISNSWRDYLFFMNDVGTKLATLSQFVCFYSHRPPMRTHNTACIQSNFQTIYTNTVYIKMYWVKYNFDFVNREWKWFHTSSLKKKWRKRVKRKFTKIKFSIFFK